MRTEARFEARTSSLFDGVTLRPRKKVTRFHSSTFTESEEKLTRPRDDPEVFESFHRRCSTFKKKKKKKNKVVGVCGDVRMWRIPWAFS